MSDKNALPPIKDLYEMYVGMKLLKEITEGIKNNPQLEASFAMMMWALKPKTIDEIYQCYCDAKEITIKP